MISLVMSTLLTNPSIRLAQQRPAAGDERKRSQHLVKEHPDFPENPPNEHVLGALASNEKKQIESECPFTYGMAAHHKHCFPLSLFCAVPLDRRSCSTSHPPTRIYPQRKSP